MKKITPIIMLLLIAFTLYNCSSSIRVLDSWKNEKATEVKGLSFLVVARTDDTQSRIAFEDEIKNQMTTDGYKAASSYMHFPKLLPDKKRTSEEEKKIIEMLIAEGFDGVILTVVKDRRVDTKVHKGGGYYAGGGSFYGGHYSTYYPIYYGGFYNYYYNPYSYSTYRSRAQYVPETTTVTRIKTYILETTVYDLTKTGSNQLIAVVTSEITDPQNIEGTAADYVKKITKSLASKK